MKFYKKITEKSKSNSLVVLVSEDTDSINFSNDSVNLLFSESLSNEDLSSLGKITVLHTPDSLYKNFNFLRIICIGVGSLEEIDSNKIRRAAGSFGRYFLDSKLSNLSFFVDSIKSKDTDLITESFFEGFFLGNYIFDKYKSKKSEKKDVFFEVVSSEISNIQDIVNKSYEKSEAEKFARDLVNEPANVLTPTELSNIANNKTDKSISCKILSKEECAKLGMNAFLGVSQGSIEEPKLIHLSYKPLKNENSYWYIGKAITFDSGGLSLKPSGSMFSMKGDMGGSAAVIAAINAIANLRLKVNIDVLCLATENMPSGSAQRPSDVVRAMNGTYIEVENTDAEGRLTLADAITYAKGFDPKFIIDIATLTGAASIGLGKGNISAFSNNKDFMDKVKLAGDITGDFVWQLPLDSTSKKQNNSTVADIKNTGGRLAGTITAAHFINHFVEEVPWVHLDIAANSMTSSNDGWHNRGATGIPTRLLIELAYIFEK